MTWSYFDKLCRPSNFILTSLKLNNEKALVGKLMGKMLVCGLMQGSSNQFPFITELPLPLAKFIQRETAGPTEINEKQAELLTISVFSGGVPLEDNDEPGTVFHAVREYRNRGSKYDFIQIREENRFWYGRARLVFQLQDQTKEKHDLVLIQVMVPVQDCPKHNILELPWFEMLKHFQVVKVDTVWKIVSGKKDFTKKNCWFLNDYETPIEHLGYVLDEELMQITSVEDPDEEEDLQRDNRGDNESDNGEESDSNDDSTQGDDEDSISEAEEL